jgi:hypothetical protein
LILRKENKSKDGVCHWLLASQCIATEVTPVQHWLASSQWHPVFDSFSEDQ